jgi:hypothetical protein
MTEVFEPDVTPPDVVDDVATDVLNEDEIVHVQPAVEDLVESQQLHSTYPPEVPHWEPGEPPEAAE